MQEIRDRQGHLLGTLDDRALADAIVARNRQGHIVAIYDAASDTTRLPNGHIYGSGNLLAAFLVSGC
ncbi:hypothetical protein [Methylobacterium radiodurans]|nr:hypothetical protein [Methylobacterium radiodurans]